MRYLVTGASGFVGRNLCEELIQQGHEVLAVTRGEFRIPGGQSYTIKNWQDKQEWSTVLKRIDVVIHLAARVHIMNDKSLDPLSDFRQANVVATKSLAEAVSESGVKKFVFLSSLHVSGTETFGKAFCESDPPKPEGPYAQSKWEAEEFLINHFRNSSVDLVMLRVPLVYGPGCGGNFLSLLKVARKVPVLPFGRFANKRSMIYVGNLVDFICRVSLSSRQNVLYLISDGEDLSFSNLLRLLTRLLPQAGRVFSAPKSLIRIIMQCAGKSEEFHKLGAELLIDSSAACRDFKWRAKYSAEEGLKQTVQWYLANYKN